MLSSPHSLANYYMHVGLETMTFAMRNVPRGKTEYAGGTQNRVSSQLTLPKTSFVLQLG